MRSRKQRACVSYGRHCVARIAAALLAVVVVVGVLRAGASYFYCPAMQSVTDAPCCSGDRVHPHGASAAAELRPRDCCEHHVVGGLPSAGATGAPLHVVAASLVAFLLAPTVETRVNGSSPHLYIEQAARAGPVALARHRAELMVALN